MFAYELKGSGETTGAVPTEAELKFVVGGTNDRDQAVGYVFTFAPRLYGALPFDPEEVKATHEGPGIYFVTIPYRVPEPDDEDPNDPDDDENNTISEFSVSADSQHITQAISQKEYGGGPEAAQIAASNVIGLTKDSVEGTDVVVPKMELVVPKNWRVHVITGNYIKNLGGLCGKVNAVDYKIDGVLYPGGELLFMGASGKRNRVRFPMEYRFLRSPNRTNIVIASGPPEIKVAEKKGHEYLWVSYKKDSAVSKLIERPESAYVAKVYEEANFKTVLGF